MERIVKWQRDVEISCRSSTDEPVHHALIKVGGKLRIRIVCRVFAACRLQLIIFWHFRWVVEVVVRTIHPVVKTMH